MRGAQQNRRTHGLGECKEWRRTVRKDDVVDEAVEIDLIFIEVAYIAFVWVAQRTVRHPLPAPVEGRDREAARTQIPHGLEILLDEFGAALEQAHRALAARWRVPAREPQRHPVAGLEGSRHNVRRHGIGGGGDEGHDLRARWGARLIAG